jgi:tetratricopeptide (TPR) repeat protein/predicted aspartyl protease
LAKLAELPVTMNGHTPIVSARVNGMDARFIADTGAFFSNVTPQSAAKFRLAFEPLPFGFYTVGATGRADVKLGLAKEFSVLGVPLHHVEFLIGAPQLGGSVDGLLGANFLTLQDAEYDLANGAIRFFEPKDCGDAEMAYWNQDQTWSELDIEPIEPDADHIIAHVAVNGVSIRAIFDTGAPESTISLEAARRAGISTSGPGVAPAGLSGGVGPQLVNTWLAPVQSLEIGQEKILGTKLRIGGLEHSVGRPDMLIGADFFLSHRIFVARSQHKLYFTYNGGPVFADEHAANAPPPASVNASQPPPGVPSDTPIDAAGFARRGAASAARRDFPGAIDDLTHAIGMDGTNAEYFYDRSLARARNAQPELAAADLEQAIKLKPDYAEALMVRGALRLKTKDLDGAGADFEAAIAQNPELRLGVAGAYAGADLFPQGIAQYDRWISDHAHDQDNLAQALNGACWLRSLSGVELDKALQDCDRAVALDSNAAEILDSRGMAHLRLGQFDKAILDYDRVLKVEPNLPWSLYGRGLAELRSGLKAQGDADIQAATTLAPQLPAKAKQYGLAP